MPITSRHLLPIVLLGSLFSSRLVRAADAANHPAPPTLVFADQARAATLGKAYTEALHNLLGTNTISADRTRYNRTGLLAGDPPQLLRAGGDYQEPWTRDASVNSWNAGSLLCPAVARNTLWAVCERLPNERFIVQRDNQWWDKLIWVTAACNHYATTGDRDFLARAADTAEASLEEMLSSRFDKEYGLFQGPSHLADGIAGYPAPFDDPPGASSFILDHPGADKLMTLSANVIAYHALRCTAKMADALKKDAAIASGWNQKADALKAAINRRFWLADQGSYAYLLFGDGPLRGKPCPSWEATGVALAILFDVPGDKQQRQVLQSAPTTKYGVPLVHPEFPRYSTEKPGRHGRIIWPMAQGYWAHAAAKAGQVARFQQETEALALLANNSQWNFFEIYHPLTGKPDGGWQCGHQWGSCSHQTWSATAFIRMIHGGLFGLQFSPEGIRFSPTLPASWGGVSLNGLAYRDMLLDIHLSGQGNRVASFSLDGKKAKAPFLPSNLRERHRIDITLEE